MIIVRKNRLGIEIIQIWFAESIKLISPFKLIAYKQALVNRFVFGFIKKRFQTVEIDLTLPELDIFTKFSQTVKNEIRRCQNDQYQAIENNSLDEFISFYNGFASAKNLPKLTFKRLSGYSSYYISEVLIKGNPVAKHFYMLDQDSSRVRLLHAPNATRTIDYESAIIGRANKFLHYQDILHFKRLGFQIYDFGGISVANPDKKLIGINNFKLSFGSTIKTYTDYYNLAYYFILLVRNQLN